MDLGGFLVQGSRPPSVQSNNRPRSAQNRSGYHTVAYQSSVDETLFSSHHNSKIDEPVAAFKAPWEYPKPKPLGLTYSSDSSKPKKDIKKRPKPKPLLWAPMPGTSVHSYKKKNLSQTSVSDVNQFWNSRGHFRNLKHTPTFIDESLFGSKQEEASFEAPWNEKMKGRNFSKQNVNSFVGNANGNFLQIKNGFHFNLNGAAQFERPKTALGISRERYKSSSNAVPIWKP